MVVDLFVLQMQATTVIGLCLNFAALHFVQDIDDVAFKVGSMGFLSENAMIECRKVSTYVPPPCRKGKKQKIKWMKRLALAFGFSTLYGCYFAIRLRTNRGVYVCNSLYVQFGDSYFPAWANYSGKFYSQAGFENNRKWYLDETGTVKLAYSYEEQAWVFSYFQQSDHTSFVKSSTTSIFEVTDLADSTWFANLVTGSIPMDWFALQCLECQGEGSCNGGQGTCVDNTCQCNEGRLGPTCEHAAYTCPTYSLDYRTKADVINSAGASVFLRTTMFDATLMGIPTAQMYGEPVYVSAQYKTKDLEDLKSQSLTSFELFTGRRWVIFGQPEGSHEGAPTNGDFLEFLERNEFADDYTRIENLKVLSNYYKFRPVLFSAPVDFGTPSSDASRLNWVFAEKDDRVPLLGYSPDDEKPLRTVFHCSTCNIENGVICENDGLCNGEGHCECLPFYKGYRCEYTYSCLEMKSAFGGSGCFNSGVCDEITGVCQNCSPGARGTLCEFPLPPEVEYDKYYCSRNECTNEEWMALLRYT